MNEEQNSVLILKTDYQKMIDALKFYAEPKNWEQGETMLYDTIDSDDCADYPHITRDVRETGGRAARQILQEMGIE
jgi:hypothetical protein